MWINFICVTNVIITNGIGSFWVLPYYFSDVCITMHSSLSMLKSGHLKIVSKKATSRRMIFGKNKNITYYNSIVLLIVFLHAAPRRCGYAWCLSHTLYTYAEIRTRWKNFFIFCFLIETSCLYTFYLNTCTSIHFFSSTYT